MEEAGQRDIIEVGPAALDEDARVFSRTGASDRSIAHDHG